LQSSGDHVGWFRSEVEGGSIETAFAPRRSTHSSHAPGPRARDAGPLIVFGDTVRRAWLAELVGGLRTGWRAARATPADLDAWRRLLILSGCLEQAVTDCQAVSGLAASAAAATDAAAEMFCAAWNGRRAPGSHEAAGSLEAALGALTRGAGHEQVAVTTPEGFAFYCLYPEQYCAAAREWSARHAGDCDRRVVVVGIRSIGTTLSAVVRASLASLAWDARRFTVRPTGPTNARSVQILPSQIGTAVRAIVADEGPGVSGSSMAAVAASLVAAGVEASRIAFFPSHSGEPGAITSAVTRRWWTDIPRHVVELDALRWRGRSVAGVLADATREIAGTGASVQRIDEVGGGRWREFVYRSQREWPAVDLQFERVKYRCVLEDGRCLLWKFAGSDDQRVFAALGERAARGWCHAPSGIAHGFVATPWLEGAPPRAAAARLRDVVGLARYIGGVARDPVAPEEGAAGVARLAEMLYWNVWEGLGSEQAERARAWIEDAAAEARALSSATYGDGRMAPREWRWTGDRRLCKLAGVAHDRDHTMIGTQSVAWDLAGAIVEWGLGSAARERLIAELAASLASRIPPTVVRFHESAYAAFRVGQATMTLQMAGAGSPEAGRASRALDAYRARLAQLLAQERLSTSASRPVLFTQRT
jgi:hypothetical protein